MQMENLTHVKRIIKILEWLSMGKSLTVAEAWEKFGSDSSKRSVQRDFKAIEEVGIPLDIQRQPGGKEYIYRFPEWYRKMVMPPIAAEELTAFYLLKGYLKQYKNTQISDALLSLEQKLETIAPGELFDFDSSDFLYDQNFGQIDYNPHQKIIGHLIEAIRAKKWVKLRYHSLTDDRVRSYEVFVHKFFHFNGALYAAVYFPKYKDTLSLAVHRIFGVEIVETKKEAPDFDLHTFTEKRFGIFTGEPEAVTIMVHPDFGKWIKGRNWHPSQLMIPAPQDWLRLDLKVPITPDFISWITSWHYGMKVIKPQSLRETIKKNLEASLAYYQD
jgi:predicted DNA-binding transcriptional regulator YafY